MSNSTSRDLLDRSAAIPTGGMRAAHDPEPMNEIGSDGNLDGARGVRREEPTGPGGVPVP